jgi:hypothetical protein
MGDTAIDGVKDSISGIENTIGNDLSGRPTITPVLDLSEVKTGIAAIGSMFGANGSIGVSTDLGSISYAMTRKGQNGANDDVVSAINQLNDNLGNFERNSYTINGITYGEGSEVADAIQTLVRAAIIERRK